MKLVDESEFKKLLSTLKIEETVSGGSVANSIVGLSQLGNDVGFIGKINADELGQKYEDGLTKEKVQYFYNKKEEVSPTGTCLILITPDAERTMVTFLGIAGKINQNDINEKAFSLISFWLIFPAIPKNVTIVLSASGVIKIKQVPVGETSSFLL